MEWLQFSPWLNLIFLLLAIFGVLTSIVLFFKSKKEKIPCKSIQSFPLIQDSLSKIDAVEILFKGQRIENLTLTKIAFWNYGSDTIHKTDVASADKLRLEMDSGGKFLNAEIFYKSREANNASIKLDRKKNLIEIDFDYFHTSEGIIIYAYHSGSAKDVHLKGTIKSAPDIRNTSQVRDPIITSTLDRLVPEWLERRIQKPGLLGTILESLATIIIIPVLIPLVLLEIIFSPIKRKIPSEFDFR